MSEGELLSVAFVPAFFELRTLEAATTAPQVIVQGGPMTMLEDNEKSAAAERTEMERVMRETEIRDIEERLRPLGEGERRLLATPEKLECSAGWMVLTAREQQSTVTLRAPISEAFEVVSFNPNAGIVEVGCRTPLPPLPAVITYRTKGGERELVEVTFVPGYFKLSGK